MWRRISGKQIENIEERIIKDVLKYQDDETLKFYIGVDSDTNKNKDIYATAIVIYRSGHGAHGYYKREYEKKIDDKSRLWMETFKAVETGVWLNELLKPYDLKVHEIHADLSEDDDAFSKSMVKSCLGYITSMGFNGKVKPYAWCSNKVAHRKSK